MVKVGVIGATGYAGAELVRILTGHPAVELSCITSRQYVNIPFDRIYPSMTGVVDLVCEEFSIENVCEKADLIFTALPHKLSMQIVPDLIKNDKKVVDLSADFRFKNVDLYESYYQPHTSKELLKKSVYGLCEIYKEDIKKSVLIGNPGCYPTSALLPLIPMILNGFINTDSIIIDSKSGVSGAGRGLSVNSLYCSVNESFKAYKVADHRHCPEMEEVLSQKANKSVKITFVPHLLPAARGMEATIYTDLLTNCDIKDIKDSFLSFYKKSPFIRIFSDDKAPDILNVRGTNYCDIGFKIDKRNNRLILLSAIDNLVKGAAGQAVQNMNIMLGINETDGLFNVPLSL